MKPIDHLINIYVYENLKCDTHQKGSFHSIHLLVTVAITLVGRLCIQR